MRVACACPAWGGRSWPGVVAVAAGHASISEQDIVTHHGSIAALNSYIELKSVKVNEGVPVMPGQPGSW